MTNQANPIARPWRRFLRFSVRAMIVVVLVVGGWLGWLVRSARIQREAVVAVERERGTVRYNGEHIVWDAGRGWHDIRPEETWAPRWLVSLLGVDFFYHVTKVYLAQLPGGAEMVSVGRLSSLEELRVEGSTEDADLAHLAGLAKLSSLDLNFTPITDAGLGHLKGLTNLSRLELCYTQVTEAGLIHLKGLNQLSELDLAGTQVTDAGLKELQQALPNLKITR